MASSINQESFLTPKQKRFCEEYLMDVNATQAAIRAGYSHRSANRIGSENMSKPVIKHEILKNQKERAERIQLDADRVLQEIACVGLFDIRSLFTKRGKLKPIHTMDEATTRALAGIDISQQHVSKRRVKEDRNKCEGNVEYERMEFERVVKVKVRDKLKALELMGRHLGMFGEGEVDRLPDLASLLLEARHRVNELNKAQRSAVEPDYTIDQNSGDGDGAL